MDIIEAIKKSDLGKYQKAIDKCNKRSGCDKWCSKEEQKGCIKLQRHSKELSSLVYDR